MNNRARWRLGPLASAIALLVGMASFDAHALGLGRITVQSALGESLRAEIDVSDLNAEETSSLRVAIATAETFKAAGLEYSSATAGLSVQLQRRTDGRPYLRLSSNRAITEPFMDLILEARWSSGRVTRDYTMLFDPPKLRSDSATIAAPTAPLLSRAPLPAGEIVSTPSSAALPPATTRTVTAKAPVVKTQPAQRTPGGVKQVTVKPGDTASRIAAQNKSASVSLDQMLVALLKANPDAFMGGNVNVIKSGAVLDIPDAQAASALSPDEATKTLIVQSRDFNTFRRKLAESVPAMQIGSASRQVDGKVQTRVEERGLPSASPDKLTLSKGAVQPKAATVAEDSAAEAPGARDASNRMAELSRNINDLNKLGASPGVGLAAGAPDTATPSLKLTPAMSASSVSAATTEEPGPTPPVPDLAPVPVASAPVPAVNKQTVVTAPAATGPSLIDQVMNNSLLLLSAGALLALLAGLGLFRYRKNKQKRQTDHSFLDSRLQPDSFFDASGGQRIDTSESPADGSSLAYSPSQLDTGGDVDPLAEADVYVAYGRDQQAEEILREALRSHPERLALHLKLLEIYAKRQDGKAFESAALAAFKLSKGQGDDWARIAGLGRGMAPDNAMYQLGASPLSIRPEIRAAALTAVEPAATALDLPEVDLDLDFSLDEAPALTPAAMPPLQARDASPTLPTAIANLEDLDFDLHAGDFPAMDLHAPPPAPALREVSDSLLDVDFGSDALGVTPGPFQSAKIPTAAAKGVAHSGTLAFDLDSISLDLGPATPALTPDLSDAEEDPLEIKFLLAEEFRILGDSEGARSLADEVLVKAKGPLKVKVQAFIDALS